MASSDSVYHEPDYKKRGKKTNPLLVSTVALHWPSK